MKALAFVICVSVLASCYKGGNGVMPLEGRYIGYFHRGGGDTSRVALYFTGNRFEGESSEPFYPFVCGGSFEQEHAKIIFADTCQPLPRYDRTLALDGAFEYQFNNDGTLRIWRQYAGQVDEYILRMPVR
jgi:hypothetical protein